MRPSRIFLSAVVPFLGLALVPDRAFAGLQTGCTTGPAIPMNTSVNPRTAICSDPAFNYCCTGSHWDLKCVEKADTVANFCGRDLWTKIQIPNTQQVLPRDFNAVAISGTMSGLVHVEDPVAASSTILATNFDLNRLKREPYAAIGGNITFCNGTVHGNVAYGASGTYTATCGSGNVTYDPTTATHTNTAGSLINWSNAFNNLLSMSLEVGAYDNQKAATKTNQQVTFAGTDPEMNVFVIDADMLLQTTSYVFNVPAGSSVIVNINPHLATGGGFKAVNISNASISGNVTPGNLLWNVTWTQDPTSFTISSMAFKGSILAPNSNVSLNNGTVQGTVVGLRVLANSNELYASPYHVPSTPLTLAKQYIKHVVVIMQENRSFDNYFSGFSGADANPFAGNKYNCNLTTCACTQNNSCTAGTAGCYSFRENPNHPADPDLGHFNGDWVAESGNTATVNGKTYISPLGFLQNNCSAGHKNDADLQATLGFHNANEIPNYWKYAQSFVLQDRMFQSVPSWSPVEHTYLVSGWNADCTVTTSNPNGICVSEVTNPHPVNKTYYWNDITNLLAKNGTEWRFYLGEDWNTNCSTCSTNPSNCFNPTGTDKIYQIWNPLYGLQDPNGTAFQTVVDNSQTGNVQPLKNLYQAIADTTDPAGTKVPAVSYIVPGASVSEHAGLTNPPVDIKNGHAYVTAIINAIMSKPALWQTTAIFLSWDDWGGFYDHQVSPTAFTNDPYGFRVPGLLISPWVQPGVDHQVLSHDAYLKLIEDLFLSGERIGKANGKASTPRDNRPNQREDSTTLGDLAKEFDFNHTPRPPLNLKCTNP